MLSPRIAPLAGDRLHLQHGPIDLVIGVDAEPEERALALRQAAENFGDILPALMAEIAPLRQPVGATPPGFDGETARRMGEAVRPHRDVFVTPMAAVAGAVADTVLARLCRGRRLTRAYVNNGGDVALHLSPGSRFDAAIVADPDDPAVDGLAALDADSPVRGLATSGWRGRSHSLGIADAVTVLARSAAADVAATLIANAVNVEDPAIRREPAQVDDPDSDLGDRPVTVAVGPLDRGQVAAALARGAEAARHMRHKKLIEGALLMLQGERQVVGGLPMRPLRDRRKGVAA